MFGMAVLLYLSTRNSPASNYEEYYLQGAIMKKATNVMGIFHIGLATLLQP